MPQVGPLEVLVVAVIALIVLGPQKLPEVARTVGRFVTEIRRMASEVRTEFAAGLDDDATAPDEIGDEQDDAIEDAVPPGGASPES